MSNGNKTSSRLVGAWFACALCTLALIGAGLLATPGQSLAEPSSSAKEQASSSAPTSLAEAEQQLAATTDELTELTSQLERANEDLADMNFELDTLKEQVTESQEDYVATQQRFAQMSVLMYKADEVGILQILTGSSNLSELLSRISQLEAVTQQTASLAGQQRRQAEQLQQDYNAVSQRKDDAEAARAELELKKAAVDVARDKLAEQVSTLQAEAAAAAAQAALAAQVQAALEAASQASSAAEATAGEGAAPEPQGAVAEEPVQQQAPEPAPAAEATADATFSTGDTSGWSSGVASAYGGSSDPSTPNPGITATGAVCDDFSMGVAVPLAWGPTAYYGRQVEISYNGQSVIATVNDCGGMGGGSRHLDLQPGVFKAFGFATCQDWGIRTVSYRFL